MTLNKNGKFPKHQAPDGGRCAMSDANFGKSVTSATIDPSVLSGWGKRASPNLIGHWRSRCAWSDRMAPSEGATLMRLFAILALAIAAMGGDRVLGR